jgi:methylated-DNA-[protein]-cysteine S-methyltransferase
VTTAATFGTPDGPFSVVVADDAVLAAGWTDSVEGLVALVHPGFRSAKGSPAVLEVARQAVRAYYDGDLDAPAGVPVRQRSGEFREHAWKVLREVGPGEAISYTEFAERSGRPTAIRAVAGACAMNAAALFVPCHRVLRSDGTLGGFRYGVHLKTALLGREALTRR